MLRWATLIASVAMFGAALLLPAAHFRAETHGGLVTYTGANFVLLGWLGPFVGQWAWLANPLLVLGWLATAVKARKLAPVLLALSAWVASWHVSLWQTELPENEAGTGGLKLESLDVGFQLWWGAIVVALLGSLSRPVETLLRAAAGRPRVGGETAQRE